MCACVYEREETGKKLVCESEIVCVCVSLCVCVCVFVCVRVCVCVVQAAEL